MMRQKLRNPAAGYATDFIDFVRRALPELMASERARGHQRRRPQSAGLPRADLRGGARARRRGPPRRRRRRRRPARPPARAGRGRARAAQHGHRRADLDRARARHLRQRLHRRAAGRARRSPTGRRSCSAGASPTPRSRSARWCTSSAGRADDWDRLAAGTIAGHILECGAQAPAATSPASGRCRSSGTSATRSPRSPKTGRFVVTKHPGTGGLVTVDTVAEQLVYEMGDPTSYITPDVTADFTSIRLAPGGRRPGARVRDPRPPATRRSSRSPPRTSTATRRRGRSRSRVRARVEKARARGRDRLEAAGARRRRRSRPRTGATEILGVSAPACRGSCAAPADPPEVVLRLAVRDRDAAQGGAVRQGDRAAGHRRPARRDRLRRRAAEGAGGRGLLAGARSTAREVEPRLEVTVEAV